MRRRGGEAKHTCSRHRLASSRPSSALLLLPPLSGRRISLAALRPTRTPSRAKHIPACHSALSLRARCLEPGRVENTAAAYPNSQVRKASSRREGEEGGAHLSEMQSRRKRVGIGREQSDPSLVQRLCLVERAPLRLSSPLLILLLLLLFEGLGLVWDEKGRRGVGEGRAGSGREERGRGRG